MSRVKESKEAMIRREVKGYWKREQGDWKSGMNVAKRQDW